MPESTTLPWYSRAIAWMKKYGAIVFGAIVAVLAGVVYWASRSQANKAKVADVAIAALKNRITALTTRRDELLKQNAADDTKVKALDAEIVENKREAVAVVKDVKGMTDAQVLDEFERLGY